MSPLGDSFVRALENRRFAAVRRLISPRRGRPWTLGGALGTLTLLAAVLFAAVPADASTSAAQRLADTYAPIVMMRSQHNAPCDASEEQYWPPTSVNVVLGNPRVRLLKRGLRRPQVIKRAPTAADLAGRDADYYLDLPGNPLEPGCKYARDFAVIRRAGRAPAVTYAHIARQPGHPGFTLQYWFYYYFNQFNDLHESDWEGMQLAFDAPTPAQALMSAPTEIVVFQHSGGEHASWDDAKVQRRGTHPVVYSAAGSHATFYGSALYLGNGQNGSGVGCDNTTTPLVALRPRSILLPVVPSGRGPFAWLSYTGRWGQREAGFNSGPAGPNTKTVWRKPLTWMDGTRDSSPKVPAASVIGPSVANAFCGAVASVSGFINLAAETLPGALAIGVVLVLLVLLPVSLTRWRPVELRPLRHTRALGQLLLAAGRMYWRHRATFVLIVLASALLIGAVDGLEWLVLRAFGASGANVSFKDTGDTTAFSTAAGVGRPIAGPVISGLVIAVLRNVEREQPAGFQSACITVLRRIWRLVGVQLLITLLLILIAVTIIGIPFAIRKLVDWGFAQQEILFEDRSIREAMRASTRLVRGQWWRAAGIVATFSILGQIPGPILGYALLFTTVPTTTVNILGSVIFALLTPYVGIGHTLLYFDLAARKVTKAVPATTIIAPAPAA
jgi:hypothetical protein